MQGSRSIHRVSPGTYKTRSGVAPETLCYVSDEIDGILRLAGSAEHEPVNIGNPVEFTMLECAKTVLEVTRSKVKIRFDPFPQDDPRQRRPDFTKARTLLGGSRQLT